MWASNSVEDSWNSRLLNNDGEIIVWVCVVEVLVRNSGLRMSNWSSDLEISSEVLKDWIVVEGVVVKVVLIGHKELCLRRYQEGGY